MPNVRVPSCRAGAAGVEMGRAPGSRDGDLASSSLPKFIDLSSSRDNSLSCRAIKICPSAGVCVCVCVRERERERERERLRVRRKNPHKTVEFSARRFIWFRAERV